MKTKTLFSAALMIAAVGGGVYQASAENSCFNCSAEVVIETHQAQIFANSLSLISSMPLKGEIVADDMTSETTIVHVSTYPDYAQSNGIDSFDVAKKLTAFVGTEYQIREIRAVLRVDLDASEANSASNVGTIGHR